MEPIVLEHVSLHHRGQAIIDKVSLRIAKGEFVGLIGPNGAGKTTILRLILGLLPPTGGRVQLLGADPWRQPAVRTRAGYLPQRPAFEDRFPLTAADAIWLALPRRPFSWRPARREKELIAGALELVNLAGYGESPLRALSGGQLQRVYLARALVNRPEVLILDEPTSALDFAAQRHFYRLLADLRRQLGLTILVVSHDLLALAAVADRFILLDKTVLASGNPRRVLSFKGLNREELFPVREVAR
ncbi:metal ABC transporter ATP-binding protein [Neomoorella thermoacetica]|uniref:metal ABC transporter ATP-binding protein n=1 Tax=Neomoorella thermoacetica TaxID=1525 RepID=UPI0008FB6A88|nr:metal ABC transporter ATP-binding protein [Moorella thermoacetica]OIQ55793.1 hemin import ATP-binding protein HmuV [Moorella thermoacetica]